MTKFAICAGSEGSIWQLDTDNPSQLPFVLYKMKPYNSYINSIALTADQQFELVCGGFQSQIRRTQDMNTDLPVYSFPASEPSSESSNLIVHVRLRTIAGEERVYFSARDRTPEGTFNFTIYYLNNGIATVYTKIDPHQVTVPNPCSPSEEFPFYQGDFEFGEADSLYLSTGHLANRARIYLIAGAGPDAVTGTVQPIYEGDGPIYGLCYRSPQTLYFLRSNAVCKLYLGTMSEGPPKAR